MSPASRAEVIRGVADRLEAGLDYDTYVTSFCAKNDLLSQWRAYGTDFGYSIGFRSASLKGIEPPGVDEPTRLLKVMYGDEEASEKIEGFPASATDQPTPARFDDRCEKVLQDHAIPLLATVKHPAFAEEQEWRMLTSNRGVDGGPPGMRPGPIGIVPYAAIPLISDAFASVKTGPGEHPEVRIKGVQSLLKNHHLDVEVSASEIPLRLAPRR
jgi:hypothetical protein